MKKFIRILSVALLISMFVSSIVFAEPINVKVNGSQLKLDVNPVSNDGITLVPLRSIFEALGATVEWDGATKTVTGTKGSTVVELQIDNNNAIINGNSVTLDVPAAIINGSTMVPVRFVAESFGAKVEWDDKTKSVLINLENSTESAQIPVIQDISPVHTVTPTSSGEGKYIGSKKSDKYHYPNYTHPGPIKPENLIWFDSVEDAQAKGYKACGYCFK